jgi:hypothetical protein
VVSEGLVAASATMVSVSLFMPRACQSSGAAS